MSEKKPLEYLGKQEVVGVDPQKMEFVHLFCGYAGVSEENHHLFAVGFRWDEGMKNFLRENPRLAQSVVESIQRDLGLIPDLNPAKA